MPPKRSSRKRRAPSRMSPSSSPRRPATPPVDGDQQDDLRATVHTLQQTVAGLTTVVADISSKLDRATNGPASGPSQNHPLDEGSGAGTDTGMGNNEGEQQGSQHIINALFTPPQDRPLLLSAGVAAGEHLPDRVKSKIWAHKYVDFLDIVDPLHEQNNYTMALQTTGHPTGHPTLSFTPKRKRVITENEWAAAWDDFLAVYLVKYPQEISDLLTYGKQIKEMMRAGLNWRFYDRQFRVARESTRCSWAAVRVDLQLNAVLQANLSPPFRQQHKNYNTNTNPLQYRPTSRIPPGFCYKYHTPAEYCNTNNCQYKHRCPKCDRKHPLYRNCYINTNPGQGSRASDSPASKRTKSAAAGVSQPGSNS